MTSSRKISPLSFYLGSMEVDVEDEYVLMDLIWCPPLRPLGNSWRWCWGSRPKIWRRCCQ